MFHDAVEESRVFELLHLSAGGSASAGGGGGAVGEGKIEAANGGGGFNPATTASQCEVSAAPAVQQHV